MRLLIDEQLPPALAGELRSAGHEADHLRDVGLGGATDALIRAHAVRIGAVILTKDEDFVSIGKEPPLAVVWIRLGNVSNTALWSALEPILPAIVAALVRGERLIEVT